MNDWTYILDFLKNSASGWVQAIGSILAILGAFKIGRAQIEADRALDDAKLTKSLVHRATVISSLAKESKFYVETIRQLFGKTNTPVLRVLHYEQLIFDNATAFKNISLFECPSLNLIHFVSIIPRSIFMLHEELKAYNEAFDAYSENYDAKSKLNLEKTGRNLENGSLILLQSLVKCIEECENITTSNSKN